MSRLATKVSELKVTGSKALIAYVVAGDPVKEVTVDLMHAMVKAGVNIIELGIPFTDPEAEGPVIQLAHERALEHGMSLKDSLAMVSQFRESDNETPVILMGYLNPIERMGFSNFASAASDAGGDGTIIVNLPPEEAVNLSDTFEDHDIDLVYLLAPTTTKDRARFVTSRSRGFVYYVSLKGTTGASGLDVDDVEQKLKTFRQISSLPVMVGFGIKDASTAAAVARISDGVVVGSAIVNLMADNQNDQELMRAKVSQLLAGMRQSIDTI